MFLKKQQNVTFARGLMFWLASLFTTVALADAQLGYDPGPDPDTDVGKGYLNLIDEAPHFPVIGEVLNGGWHKFRYPFGIMPWRGPTKKDSVKVLVIGQDGTHIAEAAGRPFTGGTGGRVQNALGYIGVRDSAMFINTYSYTIYGQYSDWAPMIKYGDMRWGALLSPEQYLMGQDPNNPIVQWRNNFIEHIIDSNRGSLRLIICIGGAAADSLATYIKSRGGEAPTWVTEENVDQYQLVLYEGKRSEGNRSVFYPVDERGDNVLLEEDERFNPRSSSQWEELVGRGPEKVDKMVKLTNGPYGNGLLHLGQLGYNIRGATAGQIPGSLKGLEVKGRALGADIRILQFKHPGAMSSDLERRFRSEFDRLKSFLDDGWRYPIPDRGMVNRQAAGEEFYYNAKPPIPEKDFPLGKSKAVIVNKSLAQRPDKQIISFGGRSRAYFSSSDRARSKRGLPSEGVEHFVGTQPWNPAPTSLGFDRGPGKEWAKLFKSIENDFDEIFRPKEGMKFSDDEGDIGEPEETDGLAALNVKNYPQHGAFGFHRGNLDNPEVIVIADPSSRDLDDMYTARALTGGVGQRLHGFLSGLGVGENYAVIKTAPFDMTDATVEEWNATFKATNSWRKKVLRKLLKQSPRLILTLGPNAKRAVDELTVRRGIGRFKPLRDVETVVDIENFDYAAAYEKIEELGVYAEQESNDWIPDFVEDLYTDEAREIAYVEDSMSIPRTHLPYPIQAFFGTSGSRGLRASGQLEGLYYGVMVPDWVLDVADNENLVAENLEKEIEYILEVKDLLHTEGFSRFGRSMSRLQTERDAEYQAIEFDIAN
ncbi:MAG: hypothetical protein CL677_06525 [Bdellovibrionaceae bacterium]|nr:hypothetical protein [Pseudobdellovibrionaceae bacterium]|tara:strand:+ start:3926 stop:6382 length:2457 start_codon:yes stop_codon:yes gene_type:complete